MKTRQHPINQLRIIGGQWRSRRINFLDLPELRPTANRVRETLFNWLMPILPGARCLDLFAGSGALGIEALSRGAAEAVFVESHPLAIAQLRDNLEKLRAENAKVVAADVSSWLQHSARPFEVVFVDPPYQAELLEVVCKALEEGGWLHTQAWIYLEAATQQAAPILPENWQVHREKSAGMVAYRLLRRCQPIPLSR